MKKYVYYCDRCKKQTEKPVRVYAHDVDLATDDPGAEHMAAVELCPDCTQKVIDLLHGGMTNYEAICKLYRDGKEMPDIELATGIPVAAISRVVAKEGLAAERYPTPPGRSSEDDDKEPAMVELIPPSKKKMGHARPGGNRKNQKKHVTITDEMVEKMIELHMSGMTYKQIAGEMGVSEFAARRHLKDRPEVANDD